MNRYEYYPDDRLNDYYIEVDNESNEVTLYRRHFFMTQDEFEKVQKETPLCSNEGHPYQIFRNPLAPLGCVPDITWYKWMVNRLNSLS